MFALAILIGIYSYLIFGLGLISELKPSYILVLTVAFFISLSILGFVSFKKRKKFSLKLNVFYYLFLGLISSLVVVNFLGVLIPETAFDALWYHLSLPKIFINDKSIHFIPGSVFYYSLMPKLVDFLYIPALMFGNEIVAKLIHFVFGILIILTLYTFSKKFLSPFYSLLVVAIFYANLVVAWQSTTAYIDLARAFFELLAFIGMFNFTESKKKIWLIESSVMMGLAISTKLISIYSFLIFLPLIFVNIKNKKQAISYSVTFLMISLLIPLPYFLHSFFNTGNPIYPFLSSMYPSDLTWQHLSPVKFLRDIFLQFTFSQDPVNPMYLIILPLALFNWKWLVNKHKLIFFYSLFSLFAWYFSPRSGGGRFIMAYLPIISLMTGVIIYENKNKTLKILLISISLLVLVTSLFYRVLAQREGIMYLLGKTSKNEYLSKKLNFKFGDFYDTDGYFESRLDSNDKVLIYGVHNLYYMNFSYIHESYVKPGDEFNYILIGSNESLPKRFSSWDLVYENPKTGVKLYTFGGNKWVY